MMAKVFLLLFEMHSRRLGSNCHIFCNRAIAMDDAYRVEGYRSAYWSDTVVQITAYEGWRFFFWSWDWHGAISVFLLYRPYLRYGPRWWLDGSWRISKRSNIQWFMHMAPRYFVQEMKIPEYMDSHSDGQGTRKHANTVITSCLSFGWWRRSLKSIAISLWWTSRIQLGILDCLCYPLVTNNISMAGHDCILNDANLDNSWGCTFLSIFTITMGTAVTDGMSGLMEWWNQKYGVSMQHGTSSTCLIVS